jgi:hypothetical protein
MLDQFYTNKNIAKKCFILLQKYVDIKDYDIILEPSAGTGSFFELLPENKKIGIDLEPKYKGITKMDFFDYTFDKNKSYIVIGNPPFGKISNMAIKFFNHASTGADVIAFIIPRTFKRHSIQNKLNLQFELIFNEDLPINPCCFTPKMNAKCCFQIWKKTNVKRCIKKLDIIHKDFDFLQYTNIDSILVPPLNSDFALLAYGGKCGKIIDTELHKLKPKSWHFIKSNININLLKSRFKQLDYTISNDSVRQNSLGKGDLILLYKEMFYPITE